jgi:hypothetical protein
MTLVKTLKLIAPTVLFYPVAVLIAELCEKWSPGGPCVPGGGMFAFFILIPIAIILVIRDIFLTINKDKQYIIRLILHAVILITFFLLAAYG